MTEKEMKQRAKSNAVAIARLCLKLPNNVINSVYVKQLVRCSSSVAANYRAACRAKSKKDFIYKLQIVEEEADETLFFIEMVAEFNPESKNEWLNCYNETEEILKIVVASILTTSKNLHSKI